MKTNAFTPILATLLIAGCTSPGTTSSTKPWQESSGWGHLAHPCHVAGLPENYYRPPEFYAAKAKDYFTQEFADCAYLSYSSSILVPVDRGVSQEGRNCVRVEYERALPRTWRSTGVPHESLEIVMNRHGALLDTSRRGFTVRNQRPEDREIIMGRFRQAGLTNYWHWSVDIDDEKQYAVRVNAYPLSDFTPLAGLPIRRLDVIVAFRPLDLSALADMPLQYLQLHKTPRCDLSPLASTRLRGIELSCPRPEPFDIAPLRSCPLEDLRAYGSTSSNHIEILREMTGLTEINSMPAAEFWKQHNQRENAEQPSRLVPK